MPSTLKVISGTQTQCTSLFKGLRWLSPYSSNHCSTVFISSFPRELLLLSAVISGGPACYGGDPPTYRYLTFVGKLNACIRLLLFVPLFSVFPAMTPAVVPACRPLSRRCWPRAVMPLPRSPRWPCSTR